MSSTTVPLPPRIELDELNARNLWRALKNKPIDEDVLPRARTLGVPEVLAEALLAVVTRDCTAGEVTSASLGLAEIKALDIDIDERPQLFRWTFHFQHAYVALQDLRYDEARNYLDTALKLAEEFRNREGASISSLLLGRLQFQRGNLSEAIEVLTRLSLPQSATYEFALLSRANLAELFVQQGNSSEALNHVTKMLEHSGSYRAADRCVFGSIRARILAASGDLDAAVEAVARARSEVVPHGRRFQVAIIDLAAASIALKKQQTDEALRLCRSTLEVLADSGNRYEALGAVVIYARCLHQSGDVAAAVQVLEDEGLDGLSSWRKAQVARLRATWAAEIGDWEEAVRFQNLVLELSADTNRRLPDLYGLLMSYRQRDDLEQQRVALAAANETLQSAQADKDDLLAIVAHDLRSPLAALSHTLKSLSLGDTPDGSAAHLKIAGQTVERVGEVTARLERLQEAEAHGTDPALVNLDPAEVVRTVCQRYDEPGRVKGLQIRVCYCSQATPVRTDEAKLTQILDNLISNAMKYSAPGGAVAVDIEVVGTSHVDERIQISVRDTGQGLSTEDQAELFMKYRRLSSRPTGAEPSTGIGLYIAQSLAVSIGAELTGASPGKGQGAVFVLSIPLPQRVNG